MLSTLARRGPDASGCHRADGIHIGHTRLSIIDLVTGDQPHFNEDRTVACILNGQIYNYRPLKRQLQEKGHVFTSNSDAEVIVHLYEEEGEAAFAALKGMFAIVIADFSRRRLLVARDRMGEKPVYYYSDEGVFCCASELKALRMHPRVSRSIDPAALGDYLRHGYVIGPNSIWKSCRQLAPAHYLVISTDSIEQRRYWVPAPTSGGPSMTSADWAHALREQLGRAIEHKLAADVPVGIFLSGGIDSSIVTALAAQASSEPLRTFSAGFGTAINELPFAKELAARYKTLHTELQVTPTPDDLDAVFAYLDEPFGDNSILPMFIICREARKHVKVVLTGDGGDELFGGYESYLDQGYFGASRLLSGLSRRLDRIIARLGTATVLERAYPFAQPASPSSAAHYRELRAMFSASDVCSLLGTATLVDRHDFPDHVAVRGDDPLTEAFRFDLNVYLPDDLLKKVDMASMHWGLECRAPLLDHELVEFALAIPPLEKIAGGQTKAILRASVKNDVPASIVNRPKQGFGAPLVSWFAGPLRSELETLGSGGNGWHGLLDHKAVQAVMARERGRLGLDWRAPLRIWTLLALSRWCKSSGIA